MQSNSIYTQTTGVRNAKPPPKSLQCPRTHPKNIFVNMSLHLCLLLGPGPMLRSISLKYDSVPLGIGAPGNWKAGLHHSSIPGSELQMRWVSSEARLSIHGEVRAGHCLYHDAHILTSRGNIKVQVSDQYDQGMSITDESSPSSSSSSSTSYSTCRGFQLHHPRSKL